MDEGRGDGRIHPTPEGADDLAARADRPGMGIHPLPDLGDGRYDEVRWSPGRLGPRDPDDEVAEHVPAARRVGDLGMELDAVEVAAVIDEAGIRRPTPHGRGG